MTIWFCNSSPLFIIHHLFTVQLFWSQLKTSKSSWVWLLTLALWLLKHISFCVNQSLRRLIAREMARIHAIHAHNGCIPKPDLWITMRKYFSIVATEFTDQASNIRWVLVGFLYQTSAEQKKEILRWCKFTVLWRSLYNYLNSFVKTHLCSHLRTRISVVACCLVGMNIERIWLFKLFCILSWWQSCLIPTTVPGGSDSHAHTHTHTSHPVARGETQGLFKHCHS